MGVGAERGGHMEGGFFALVCRAVAMRTTPEGSQMTPRYTVRLVRDQFPKGVFCSGIV